ncbi:MAG: amidophosphoribosyltransferase [Planctomycetota bacterium]
MTPELKEACGLCGVYGVPQAALLAYYGIFALQHRGQESAGIVASDGINVRSKKGLGLVGDVFAGADFSGLPGHIALGHVRYSTSGGNKPQNVQPLVVDYAQGLMAVAHNGNLVNARTLRQELENTGSIFQTGTDSEVVLHLLARPKNLGRGATNLGYCLTQLRGAYAFLFMTRDTLTAACDPHKFRPLAIGRLEDGWIVASETCAFDLLGATYERDVEPGEIVTFSPRGVESAFFVPPEERTPAHCIFEMIYFARPDSNVFGENVHMFRSRLGARLAAEHPASADMVIAVPDSGNSHGIGYAEAAGIPFRRGFIRNHYVGRTFIQPRPEQRVQSVRLKLNVIREEVAGKRLVVVDDSIIRGTTCKSRLDCLRQAGAAGLHMRVASPPCRFPCYYGIDFPTRKELIAAGHSVDETRTLVGADSLGYISPEGLRQCSARPDNWCTACFTGAYPIPPVDTMEDKFAMDRGFEEQPGRSAT